METTTEANHKTPLTLGYIKMLKKFLKPPGTWPAEIFGEKLPLPVKIHRVTLPYHTSVIVFGVLHYLIDYWHNLAFLDMGQLILTALLAVLTAVRSVVPTLQKYYILIGKYIRELHLMHYTHKGEYYVKMDKKIEKLSTFYTRLMMVLMVLAMVMFNVAPMYHNIQNVIFLKTENYTYEFSLYMSFPGFKPINHFAFATVYNMYLAYNCGVMLSGLDLILFLMIFQVIGHTKILRHNLEHFPSPKNKFVFKLSEAYKSRYDGDFSVEMYDDEENKLVQVKLAECIEHHKFIIQFTDDLSDLFGPVIAFNYMFHMVGCCLLLLECTGGEPGAMLRYGPLTIVVFGQLIQISIMFEIMGSEAEKLKDSAYMVPWECMSISNRRTAHIMLHKMQYKISLKALGLAAVGVNTMAGILKTTFSYYAFLQTLH